MKCGECKWHFDMFGLPSADAANCLARSWPSVLVVFTTRDAVCNLPDKFESKRAFKSGEGDMPDARLPQAKDISDL